MLDSSPVKRVFTDAIAVFSDVTEASSVPRRLFVLTVPVLSDDRVLSSDEKRVFTLEMLVSSTLNRELELTTAALSDVMLAPCAFNVISSPDTREFTLITAVLSEPIVVSSTLTRVVKLPTNALVPVLSDVVVSSSVATRVLIDAMLVPCVASVLSSPDMRVFALTIAPLSDVMVLSSPVRRLLTDTTTDDNDVMVVSSADARVESDPNCDVCVVMLPSSVVARALIDVMLFSSADTRVDIDTCVESTDACKLVIDVLSTPIVVSSIVRRLARLVTLQRLFSLPGLLVDAAFTSFVSVLLCDTTVLDSVGTFTRLLMFDGDDSAATTRFRSDCAAFVPIAVLSADDEYRLFSLAGLDDDTAETTLESVTPCPFTVDDSETTLMRLAAELVADSTPTSALTVPVRPASEACVPERLVLVLARSACVDASAASVLARAALVLLRSARVASSSSCVWMSSESVMFPVGVVSVTSV